MGRFKICTCIVLMILASVILCACESTNNKTTTPSSNKDKAADSSNNSESRNGVPEILHIEANQELIDKYAKNADKRSKRGNFTAETNIGFSEGNMDNWDYSKGKKEFPMKSSYNRIMSNVYKKHFWEKKDKVYAYYMFTGVENCDIQFTSSDNGQISDEKCNDSNVKIFKKELYPSKRKEPGTSDATFKLTPKRPCVVRLDVIYDESFAKKYDHSRIIYFSK